MQEVSFGEWLRKQRRALDLSRQAFADQVGCAEVTLRRIEAGTLKPSKELVSILLEKLGIPKTELSQWTSFARGLSGPPHQSTPSLSKPITNLPAPLTTFIGRAKEQSEVIKLIAKYRLITLTGSGGVGKTRFAIKVGEQLVGDYPDGVWLLELASLNDHTLLPQVAATLFGLRMQPGISYTDLLINHLRTKSALLILDNCEHLLDACAPFAETLLKNCADLKVLITSREPLEVAGEALYRIPSLRLPDVLPYQMDTLTDFEAVKLLEERAQLIQFDFPLTPKNAVSVVQICRHLDGIPLAIELAAAKVRVLSPTQIANQLGESLNVLARGSRTALPRHQTLRATIEWSYGLLSEKERLLFNRLAVFVGGWTLAAAEEVCRGNGIEANNILDLLSQLVNKSLLIVENRDSVFRYHGLETIRQFMWEKLMNGEERDIFFQAHAEYFLKFAEAAEPQLVRAQQILWINRLEIEHDNLRAALQWFMRTEHADSALRLTGALGHFWHIRGLFSEGQERLEDALQVGIDSDKKLQAKALCWVGSLAYTQGHYEVAQSALNHSLAISLGLSDKRGMADALYFIGIMNRIQEDYAKAQDCFEESMELYYNLNDTHGVANALINLGSIFQSRGDDEKALALFEEGLGIFQELAYKRGIAYATLNLGNITYTREDVQRSWEFYKESLLLSYELGDRWSVAYAL